jgi:hypothetical protein
VARADEAVPVAPGVRADVLARSGLAALPRAGLLQLPVTEADQALAVACAFLHEVLGGRSPAA